LVFQNPSVQMLTVTTEQEIIFGLENLGLPPSTGEDRLEAALTHFGLEPFRRRSPQTLSGGEQQKLALAAIMARRPPVLVLDEPLSMLDSTAALRLVAHVIDLAQAGTAVIICEHRSEYLRTIPNLRILHLNGSAAPTPDPSDVPPLPNRLSRVSRPTLNVDNLSIDLGDRPILRDLSFAVQGGMVLAIVGRNGVGKTTLLRALAGLQRYRGRITVGGQEPDLGMVFQNPDLQFFNATVHDEVLYRLDDPDLGYYDWLITMLGLGRYGETPPLLLSEGEKKRLALAVALMSDPRHGVLLDEPALGQDATHKRVLLRLARALSQAGQLVIFATHDLGLAAEADRLLILSQDGIAADGPPNELLNEDALWTRVGLVVPPWVASK
jgi:energy-coupling factor transport system ATP-binding protein